MKFTLPQIESRVAALLERASSFFPTNEVNDIVDLIRHGEPGVALENFCEQLYEREVRVPSAILTEIAVLGEAMGMKSRYWEMLTETRPVDLRSEG